MFSRRLMAYTSAAALAFLLIVTLVSNTLFQRLGNNAEAATDHSVKLGFYYNNPSDGTSASTVANRSSFVISSNTRWRDDVRNAGFQGTVLRYFAANEVEGPGPYKNKYASCDSSYDPLDNQAAYNQGDFCKYVHPNEDWFLHNGRGERLVDEWFEGRTLYHMNHGHPGWRAFARSRFNANISGFTGLYLDNVELNLYKAQRQIINSDGVVKEYSTDDAFRSAMLNYLRDMNSLPGTLWANLVNDDRKGSHWDLYLPHLDGVLQEAWGIGYQPLTAEKWHTNMVQTEKALAQGKGVMMGGFGDRGETTKQQFLTASYLLVTNGKQSYFRYSKSSAYRQWWYYSNYDVKLGAPKGARYQSGSQWRRDFACGYVTVDPVAKTGKIVTQSCSSTAPAPTTAPVSAPSGAIALPGRIEAEKYKTGGANVGYSDTTAGNSGGAYRQDDVDIQASTEGGYNVGWITPGEWLAYDVNVASTGTYTFKARVATNNTDRRFRIEVDGVNVTGSITVPNTGGWQTWTSVSSKAVSLSAGAHKVRFVSEGSGFNLNAIDVVAGGTGAGDQVDPPAAEPTAEPTVVPPTAEPTAVPPVATPEPTAVPPVATPEPTAVPPVATPEPTPEPTAVPPVATPEPTAVPPTAPAPAAVTLPGRFEVEDYKAGGANVGYSDTTGGNSGGAYRQDDVDIQPCNDGAGCHSIGWIMPGEWLAYDVNVAADGAYTFNVRASAMDKGRRVHIEIDGVDVTGPIEMQNTGAWQNWATVSSIPVPLTAGAHTLRIVMDDHGINLNSVEVVSQ